MVRHVPTLSASQYRGGQTGGQAPIGPQICLLYPDARGGGLLVPLSLPAELGARMVPHMLRPLLLTLFV